MINLSAVANEVFQILRSFDYTVMMYDDEGMQVYEPEDARRMFAKPENLLVSLVEDNDDSAIKLYLSGKTDVESVLGLITALRTAANKYNMIFDDQKWDRDLSVKDFATKSSVRENVEPMMDLTEGMYGTSRSSYLKLENARMIVRHSAKIDENVAGARSRRVESIFVENAQGERFLFPTKQLAPARAMTQHLNHGGSFADEVGGHINQMANDYAALGQASSFIGMNQPVLGEGAVELREKCRTTRKGLRRCFERLYRESSYDREVEALREAAANPVLVEDATVERLREMLTIEGKELSEEIISTIARCVESAQPVLDEALDEPKVAGEAPDETMIQEKRVSGPTVKVLGKDVDEAAWNAFKDGHLELRASPESIEGPAPRFANRAAELAFHLRAIAPLCMDDSMSNLLSWAAEELPVAHDRLLRQLMTLGTHACQTQHVHVTEGLGFRGSRVIREFEEWFDSMGSDRVLSPLEDDIEPMGADLDEVGADMAPAVPAPDGGPALDPMMGVQPDAAVAAPMDAPMGAPMDAAPVEVEHDYDAMAADIANGYTEGTTWRLNFPEKDRASEVVGEKTAMIQISNAVLGGSDEGSVHSDPAEGPRQSFHWTIESTMSAAPVPAPVGQPPMVPPAMDPMMGESVDDDDGDSDTEEADSDMLDEYVIRTRGSTPKAHHRGYYDPKGSASARAGSRHGIKAPKGHRDFTGPAAEMTVRDNSTKIRAGEDDLAEDLTREDILLPKNQAEDLKQEVGHPVDSAADFVADVGDDDKSDGDDDGMTVERLRKLSGIRIAD